MDDIKRKIRKLLDLAGNNPSQNEANSALIKARQLMAKHRLSEGDLNTQQEQEVVDGITNFCCTKRRDGWLIDLSCLIAERHRCVSFRRHVRGKQVNYVGFMGFRDDYEVCTALFEFAAHYALKETKAKGERLKRDGLSAREIRPLMEAFGDGFVAGLREAYKRQDDEDKRYALVLQVPEPVMREASKNGKPQAFRMPSQNDLAEAMCHAEGLMKGLQFPEKTRIEGAS